MKRRPALAAALSAAFAAGFATRPAIQRAYRGARSSPPDLTVPVGREAHRHLAFLRRLERGPRDVPAVLFGDSVTECWSLVPDLQDAAFGPGAVNFGVGYDGVEHVLWRVRNGGLDPARVSARVVVLCVGTNNLADGHPPTAVAAGVAALADEVRRVQPNARVVLLAIPPRGRTAADPLRLAVAETNRLLAVTPGVAFAAVGKSLVEPDGTIDPAVMPDYLHPSPEGYRRWAAEIVAALR